MTTRTKLWISILCSMLVLSLSATGYAFIKLNAANTAKLPSIQEHERGLVFTKENQLVRILIPGRYKLQAKEDYVKIISIADRIITFQDDTIRTVDDILYTVQIILVYHRVDTEESLFGLWRRYPVESTQDFLLDELVEDMLAVAVKLSATTLTAEETFSAEGINTLNRRIDERLTPVLAARGCVLVKIEIKNLFQE